MSKNKNKKEDDIPFGIGLSVAFIIIATFVYLQPEYLGSSTVSIIFSSIFITIGVAGLGIELNKLNDKQNSGFENMGIGLGFLMVWAVLHYFFPLVWVNWLLIVVLLFALIFITTGIANLVFTLATLNTKKKLLTELPIVITQIGATIIAIYEILNALELL
ncbi:hypothetical protein [Bacillus sp. N1-1]|uniref:hypothetical protein n=1 Tax=Bacillus sp. N1-1 TaxID=2682541 RepID=UPI0013187E3B|nr:hypothetical protein [Bacillus sp. N1-1]QHA92247.1 hypothetical protein GNK04_12870 [Bacillus sp. N1-1]